MTRVARRKRPVLDLATAVRDAVPCGVNAAIDAASVGLPALDAVRGGLRLGIAHPLPLSEVAEARRRLEKGDLRGRLVLVP